MTIEVRRTRPDERRAAIDAFITAIMAPPLGDEAWERGRPSWEESSSWSAWDGDRCVGHAAQFLVDTIVPGGGRLATGAVSRVGVLPTHRRRGIASRLMAALLDDATARGCALMSLRASEAVIYQRYGFGIAGDACTIELLPARARPIAGAAAGSIRLLAPIEIHAVVEPLYERVGLRRSGAVTRPSSWWQRYLRAAVERSAASYVAVHLGAGGEPDGYVHYDVAWEQTDEGATGRGEVHDLFGADDAVELALWRYLCDIDLVTRWKATERPLDDVVRSAVRDPRAAVVRDIDDEQWLRIVDVGAALTARTYRPAASGITVEVSDPARPHQRDRWRIDADGTASRTSSPPDIEATVAALSAAYLGGVSWWRLSAVGAVRSTGRAALDAADGLFATPRLPVCSSFF